MASSPDEILAMVFLARVVQEGSFTRAAAKLGVSKSVVSTRIAALEDRLRVRLLHRTTRKLSLTPDGLVFFERCARVVAAADEAATALEAAGDTPHGLLRVNAPVVFAEDYLAQPMAAYLERYPDVRIDLTLNDKVLDLAEENVDVAVRVTSRLRGANVIGRKLATDRTVLCASPAYLARRGSPQTAQDLVRHDCLIYSLLKVKDEWRFREPGTNVVFGVPIEGRFSAASGALLRQAALAGMGLTVLPTFMIAEHVTAGRLQVIVGSFQGVELGVYALYPQTRRPPSKVRAFVDLLVRHFRRAPWQGVISARHH